jgi:hypothetical protein
MHHPYVAVTATTMRSVFNAYTHWFSADHNRDQKHKLADGNTWNKRLSGLLMKEGRTGIIKQWSAIAGWPDEIKQVLLAIYERAYSNVCLFVDRMYDLCRRYTTRANHGTITTSSTAHNLVDWPSHKCSLVSPRRRHFAS